MGVDHRRDRIGGVVEAVHEFEPQRDQQRQREEQENPRRQRFADLCRVRQDAGAGIAQRADQDGQEDPPAGGMQAPVEARAACSRLG
jgi:hypothetical protein